MLEVDGNGRPTVVGKAPTAETAAAVQRLVELGVRAGHRFDRAARRRLRERLLGGESEAQLAAPYERWLAEAEKLDSEELDQSMRLLAAPEGAA